VDTGTAPPSQVPPSRRTLVLLVAPIAVLITIGTIANASTPYLLKEHPLVLIAAEARNRNLILAASRVDPVPYMVFGVLRRLLSDPLFFLLGYFYGENAVRWAERRMGGTDWIVRFTRQGFRRAAGVMVFLFPGALVCVLAGVSRMRIRTFLVLNFTGTVAMVIVLRIFADVFEGPVGAIQRFNDRNFRWLLVVSAVGVAGYVLLTWRQGDSDIAALRNIEQELEGGSDAAAED
jgi:membrane protein DedA with SNARE-associated domain